ncbi:MAG: SDR family oxidoreductase [Deltaproteobacteria bacterium]|nr:SDR family oxidoreductase [Deltaproteobacteria bacterium]
MTAYRSIFRDGLFDGQVALVTGGGSGIGRAIAHELASLDAFVVISGRKLEKLDTVVAEISEAGGRAEAMVLDIRDDEAVDAAIADLVARHGRLDAVVNNAGGQFVAGAEEIRPKGWRAVIDTNLNGTFWVSRAAFLHAMGERGGAIVSIVADMWNGFPGMAHTGAARAAVVNMTKTMAVEWASRGVRVNAVAPGGILSSGLKNYPRGVLEMALPMLRGNPTGRMGTESEVAAAVTFLLSPAASYITGETLRVDGAGSLCKVPMVPLEPHQAIAPYDGLHLPADLPEGVDAP